MSSRFEVIVEPKDLSETARIQLDAIHLTMKEGGGETPIPADSPLGQYLIQQIDKESQ